LLRRRHADDRARTWLRKEVLPRFFQLSKQEAKAVSAALRPDEAAPHRDVVTTVRGPVAAALDTRGPEVRALVAPAGTVRGRAEELVHPDEPGRANSSRTAERDPDRAEDLVHPDEPGRANFSRTAERDPDRAEDPVHPDELRRANLLLTSQAERPPARASAAEPLTADLSRLHVTVSRRFLEKLEAARAALSHARPGAGVEEILEAGLDRLLERQAKRKGVVAKPRHEPPPSKPEHVPAHVKRAVWERDGGRCQWKVDSGGVCGSTHQVEIDHVVPRARGGTSTVSTCRLLCRRHNDLAARQIFGDAWMDRFTRGRGAATARDDASRAPSAAPA
jgi:HNH endonuclease